MIIFTCILKNKTIFTKYDHLWTLNNQNNSKWLLLVDFMYWNLTITFIYSRLCTKCKKKKVNFKVGTTHTPVRYEWIDSLQRVVQDYLESGLNWNQIPFPHKDSWTWQPRTEDDTTCRFLKSTACGSLLYVFKKIIGYCEKSQPNNKYSLTWI